MNGRLTALMAALSVAVPAASWAMSPKDVYKKDASAVVLVLGSDDGKQGSGGTGSFITSDGKIITNAHVVLSHESSQPYRILYVFTKPPKVTGDNAKDLAQRYKAHVLAFSPPDELDLALLQLEDGPSVVPTIPFADPDKVDVGDEVVAIGHPEQGGLWTLTTGAISTVISNYNRVKGKDVFQTEASVNRGNSGGPLLDTDGNMVGINTMIARQSADGVAITAVNFSLKSSVAVSWLASQRMTLAYAAKGAGDATVVASAGTQAAPGAGVAKPPSSAPPSTPASQGSSTSGSPSVPPATEVASASAPPSPALGTKVSASTPPPSTVVVAKAPPAKSIDLQQVASGIAAKEQANSVTKGRAPDPAAQPKIVTEKHPFNMDDLRKSQMRDLEKMMDEMRVKTGAPAPSGSKANGMGLW